MFFYVKETLMQAIEFRAKTKLTKIKKQKRLAALKLKTKGIKFDRDEANER